MVKFDIREEVDPGGICEMIEEQASDHIERLLSEAGTGNVEYVTSIGISDGRVITGGIYESGEGVAEFEDKVRAIFDVKQESDKIGTIHTHPVEREDVNLMPSGPDMAGHLNSVHMIEGYAYTLTATRNQGDTVLFGVETEPGTRGLGEAQDRVTQIWKEVKNGNAEGQEALDMYFDMVREVGKTSEWCYKEIGK